MKRMRTKEARFYRIFRQPEYRRDFLRRDIAALESFYRMNGFFEARVTIDSVVADEKSHSVKIRIMVAEGPQSVVRALRFAGQDLVSRCGSQKGPQARPRGAVQSQSPRSRSLHSLEQVFRDGIPRGAGGARRFARIRRTSISTGRSRPATRSAYATPAFRERERCARISFGASSSSGGEIYSARRTSSRARRTSTTPATSARSRSSRIPIDVARREVDLVVKVRERKMGYIETGIGVGKRLRKPHLRGMGAAEHFRNGERRLLQVLVCVPAFSGQRVFSSTTSTSGASTCGTRGSSRFPTSSGHGTRSPSARSTNGTRRSSRSSSRISGSPRRVARRFSRQTSLLVGYSIERIQRLEVEEEKSRSRRRAFFTTFSRDTRDFYFNPQRGSYITGEGRFTGGIPRRRRQLLFARRIGARYTLVSAAKRIRLASARGLRRRVRRSRRNGASDREPVLRRRRQLGEGIQGELPRAARGERGAEGRKDLASHERGAEVPDSVSCAEVQFRRRRSFSTAAPCGTAPRRSVYQDFRITADASRM